jgi:hypothetical protein
MSELKTEVLPGGISVAAGGTRTRVCLQRPWQTQIRVEPATCPLEKREHEQEAHFELEGGWRVLPNVYTPFSWHKLIIPEQCWSPERLRTLGGLSCITVAFAIAFSIVFESGEETWLGVHVGPGAGQNISHLHYHLLCPIGPAPHISRFAEIAAYSKSPARLIFRDEACVVVAGGCRAGQCFFVPAGSECEDSASVARTVSRIIGLYNRKFESKEGMPPDYMLGLTFRNRKFEYGVYTPVLNNWGFTEYLGLIEGRPLILPWPHEETVRHLREE